MIHGNEHIFLKARRGCSGGPFLKNKEMPVPRPDASGIRSCLRRKAVLNSSPCSIRFLCARVAKLAYALDLGSSGVILESSSLSSRTTSVPFSLPAGQAGQIIYKEFYRYGSQH